MRHLIIGAMVVMIFFGCTPEQSTISEYQIENGLNIPIVLRFYRNGLPSAQTSVVTLEGLGNTYKKFGEALGSSTTPFDVFSADSILIVFDGKRIQGHNMFEPNGFSLLNQQDYQKISSGRFLYLIDQKNYNNATPCDGPCY
jgi:hypothetical protein